MIDDRTNREEIGLLEKSTVAVRSGIGSDNQYGSVIPPIFMSTNFIFTQLGEIPKYDYSRSGNPTVEQLESTLSHLENGFGAIVTNSGTSAINLVLSTTLDSNSLVLVSKDCYGGTHRLFVARQMKGDFNVRFVDTSNIDKVKYYLEQGPKLIFIETPSNPLLKITDIEKITSLAKSFDTKVVVDNTFLTPIYQTPLDLGADFVVHSLTKFINGHSDCLAGAVICKHKEDFESIKWWGNCIGSNTNSFDAFLTSRGLRTLSARLKIHEFNTKRILDFFLNQKVITKIYYPSLCSHDGHEIASRQQKGFGSIISCEFNLNSVQIEKFINSLQLFSLAESLGGAESLVCHPASMTHRAMEDNALKNAGISKNLLRFSIGIEDYEDLLSDLNRALNLFI